MCKKNLFKLNIAVVCLAIVCWSTTAVHAKKKSYQKVGLFEAIKNGQIEVKWIPKGQNKANMIVKNKTDQPLTIQPPEAFAAMPVLAQLGDDGGDQGGGAGGGAGFNIAPEKVTRVKMKVLCLEHGKDAPNARSKYEIKPISAIASNPKILELIKGHSSGLYPTSAAQAAAWHIQNGMSWKELAAKRIKRLGQRSIPYFSQRQLLTAMKVVKDVEIRAKKRSSSSNSTKSLSDYQK